VAGASPCGRAKCLPWSRRGGDAEHQRSISWSMPAVSCPKPYHPMGLQRPVTGDPTSCPTGGSGAGWGEEETSNHRCSLRSCCPRPIHLILKHIPMCCTVVGCFPLPPAPHFTALFVCSLVLRQIYNEGGPEQPVLTLLLLPPPQPRSGFIRTPSTLLVDQSPTELITGEPIFFQPLHNGASPMLIPTCQSWPAGLHPCGMQVGVSGGEGDTWEK